MIDAVYCLSLERLVERRKRSIELLSPIDHCPVYLLDAVDARRYTIQDFYNEDIYEYKDWEMSKEDSHIQMDSGMVNMTYWQRPVSMAEIASTVGHYLIWKHSYKMGYSSVLIFEDDVEFDYDELMEGLSIYEEFVKNNYCDIFFLSCNSFRDKRVIDENIVQCDYAYNLHSYILTRESFGILLNAGLLDNLIVSDEFLPALYGDHPREDIQKLYSAKRKLMAYRLKENIVRQNENPTADLISA